MVDSFSPFAYLFLAYLVSFTGGLKTQEWKTKGVKNRGWKAQEWETREENAGVEIRGGPIMESQIKWV